MTRGKRTTGTEIEALDAGLSVGAGQDYIPPTVAEELGPMTRRELVDLGKLGDRLKDAVRIRNGWVWMMLRRKVGHGSFKKTVEEEKLKYFEVWQDMCYARAVQRFPGFAGKIAGDCIRHVLTLPAENLYKIEEQITGIPADEAKKLTRSWIEKEYRKIQMEKQKPRKKHPPVDIPQDEKWDKFSDLIVKAIEALGAISVAEFDPAWYEHVFKYKFAEKLGRVYGAAIEKLHPIEEVMKRAETIHAPGFAASAKARAR